MWGNMSHWVALSLFVLLSVQGLNAQAFQRQTVSVQMAQNSSGSPAVEGNDGEKLVFPNA